MIKASAHEENALITLLCDLNKQLSEDTAKKGRVLAKIKFREKPEEEYKVIKISRYKPKNPDRLHMIYGTGGKKDKLREGDMAISLHGLLTNKTPFASDSGTGEQEFCLKYELLEKHKRK